MSAGGAPSVRGLLGGVVPVGSSTENSGRLGKGVNRKEGAQAPLESAGNDRRHWVRGNLSPPPEEVHGTAAAAGDVERNKQSEAAAAAASVASVTSAID